MTAVLISPGDQRSDDARAACSDSAPLAEATAIAGRPRVTLRLRAEAAQGQIAVRLNHVHPDGAVTRITYGVLNLRHRTSAAAPQAMPMGEEFEVHVALDEILQHPAHHLAP